jgi:thymidylate synthase
MSQEQIYLDQLRQILENGSEREDRTGVGTISIFGMQARYNVEKSFPAITTKKLYFKGVKAELLWFLEGSNDYKRLNELGSKIWDANGEADYWKPKAEFEGHVGRIYGVQWRDWINKDGKHFDQIERAIKIIKEMKEAENHPDSRRIIVNAWNVGELDEMALPPCHVMFQFYVDGDKLSLQMYQRSADMFLGVPFNIASYSLLLHMVAQVTDMRAYEFVHTIGDAHIYLNHLDQVEEQLSRDLKPAPKLRLNPEIKDIDDFTMEDIELINYEHHPRIKAEMAV